MRARAVLISALVLALSATVAWTGDAMLSPATATVRQTGKLVMHPQIVQPGTYAANANGAQSAMTAVFRPIRAGRTVWLQRLSGRRWVNVKSGREDGRGEVAFSAPYRLNGHIVRYRAFASPYRLLPRVNSTSALTNRWGLADFNEQFSGTFSGNDLPRNWTHREQAYGAVSNRTCSASVPTATKVLNGAARLSVIRSGGPQPLVRPNCRLASGTFDWRINGHIGTQGKYAFRYGYAAARIKFQRNAGQHASFWLVPATTEGPSGAKLNGAEIDTIEWFGDRTNDNGELSNFVHVRQSDGTYKKLGGLITQPRRFGADWYSKYHVFSVEWTPYAYVFRIDGRETRRLLTGVSGQPEFIVLSLLSSDWELPFAKRALTQSMFVDWVRVWDRRP